MTATKPTKAIRRALIMNAAITCFIHKGMHQTGMRDIAKQANISLGNLYNYFSSKNDLIAEIAVLDGEGLDIFATALNANADALMAMREFIDDYLDYMCSVENSFLTIDIIAESLRNPAIAKQFEINRTKLLDALVATIKHGMSENSIRQDISDIEETVKLILDAIEGLGLRCGLANTTPSQTARDTLHDMIFRMLTKPV